MSTSDPSFPEERVDDEAAVRVKNLRDAGLAAEGQRNLAQAAALYGESLELAKGCADTRCIADLLFALARIAWMGGDSPRAAALHEESLARYRELGDTAGVATQLHGLGLALEAQGQDRQAFARYTESLSLSRTLNDLGDVAAVLLSLGRVARTLGDLAAAKAYYEESVALLRSQDNRWYTGLALMHLGDLAREQGNAGEARTRLGESQDLFRQEVRACLTTGSGVGHLLLPLAGLAALRDEGQHAAQLLGAAAATRPLADMPLAPYERDWLDRIVRLTHILLDEAVWAASWERGQRMSPMEAVAQVVGAAPAGSSAGP